MLKRKGPQGDKQWKQTWTMTGMSTLFGRDTVDGFMACKRRRLESEQKSAADFFRRRNLCAILRYRGRSCCSLAEKSFGLQPVSAGNAAQSIPVYVQDVACMLSHHFRENRDIHATTPHQERKRRGLHLSEHATGDDAPVLRWGLLSGHS